MPDDYVSAAKRHRDDAEQLAAAHRFDNAGHLIGFAGECAMKHKLRELLRKPAGSIDGHHPRPQTMIRTHLQQRRMAGPWLALVNGPNLFDGWDIGHRYAADGTVTAQQYERWKQTTLRIFREARIR